MSMQDAPSTTRRREFVPPEPAAEQKLDRVQGNVALAAGDAIQDELRLDLGSADIQFAAIVLAQRLRIDLKQAANFCLRR